MAGFEASTIAAAASEQQVTLTTKGRRSGRSVRVTIWIAADGERIFVRSGGGLGRHWPQNLMTHGDATLRLAGRSVRVRPRHVTDAAEARDVSALYRKKYGSYVKPSKPNEALTEGEKATFELLPAD